MRDKSGAQRAPAGSGLGIMPANSGGTATTPRAPGHDCSRRGPSAAGSPSASVTQSTTQEVIVYDRLFTAEEVQSLEPADSAPVLDGEIHALQVLIWRVLAIRPDRAQPRGRRRGGADRRWQRTVLFQQIAAIGRACDILQRMLKTQRALAPDGPSELDQLLDEAAKYMDNPSPPEDLVIEEYDPDTRTIRPFRDP